LYLNKNKIQKVTDTIGNLRNLEILNISQNLISVLPDSIGYLKKLKELDLSDNRGIKNITRTASQWQDLKKINLSRTGFPKFPSVLFTWANLQELSCRDLVLDDAKIDTKDLENLEKLDIRELGIEKLPESLTACGKITHLNAKNNNIVDSGVPMGLSKWSFCIYLNLA
jgi:Leucine-rich repeat (LRR) protein